MVVFILLQVTKRPISSNHPRKEINKITKITTWTVTRLISFRIDWETMIEAVVCQMVW